MTYSGLKESAGSHRSEEDRKDERSEEEDEREKEDVSHRMSDAVHVTRRSRQIPPVAKAIGLGDAVGAYDDTSEMSDALFSVVCHPVRSSQKIRQGSSFQTLLLT